MRRKIVWFVLLLGGVFYTRAYCQRADLAYTYKPQVMPESFADFAREKIAYSRSIGVADFSTEKLTVNNPKNDGYAILYIHGFGATRAEGEAVVDQLATHLRANVFYARLPGHATTAEAHAAATFDQYLQEMETAFLMMPKLGKKLILIGTSTGALVSTYLASKYSDQIHGLILASPFWDFGPKITRLMNFPGGLELAELALGKNRDASWKSDPEKRLHPDYGKHWLTQQKLSALVNLNNLRRFVVNDEAIQKISCPAIGIFYYENAEKQDSVIDLAFFRKKFPLAKHPRNKLVEIADGNHILLSTYVRSDKKKIFTALTDWLKTL